MLKLNENGKNVTKKKRERENVFLMQKKIFTASNFGDGGIKP